MAIERLASLSVHTSPLASPGGKKTGGMNVHNLSYGLIYSHYSLNG
jgi:hypothetical protein